MDYFIKIKSIVVQVRSFNILKSEEDLLKPFER